MSERLGHRHFKGAHAGLEAHEALIYRLEPPIYGIEPPIHGLEPPIYGLEPLMDFRPEAFELLVHQDHTFGHQLDPGLQVFRNDVEVAAGFRIARPHLCPKLVSEFLEPAVHVRKAAVHRFEAPVQIGDKLWVHAGTLPPRRGGVKCLLDETRSRLRPSCGESK